MNGVVACNTCIGNKDGTLWSDTGKLAYPISAGSPQTYTRNNAKWVSAFSEIRGTSWMYAVEIPERAALPPARALLTPFVIVGVLI